MTATGHAIIGTVLAAQITNPIVGIPVAILSHLAADAFPHWDAGTHIATKSRRDLWIHSIIDVVISLIIPFFLMYFLAPQTNLIYVYSMVIAAQLFDWGMAPYIYLHQKYPPFSWSYFIQLPFDNKLDKPWGIIWQAAVLLLLIVWAKIF